MSQQHNPVPPHPDGNTKNSGFEANAFVVWVDGVRQGVGGGFNATFTTSDVTASAEVHQYDLTGKAAAAIPAGTHDVRIFKATEADWNGGSPVPNYVTFYGIKVLVDGTAAGAASTAPPAWLEQPPPLPTRKIEFLGDSITAGFCNECQHTPVDPSDHREAYGATWDHQICTLLDAQCHTAAWSGLGMVKNCCGGNTTMPTIFKQALATDVSTSWTWSDWVADALVINLGTNDGGAARTVQYVETYTQLVVQASKNYGDNLHVFLACGPMSTTYCDSVHTVIANAQQQGVKAHFLDQRGFLNGTFGPGCCGHPGIEVDTAMAKSGAAFIKASLGW